jgi:hypothetical protein
LLHEDGWPAPEVGIGGCQVLDALVVAVMIVVVDEAGDLRLFIVSTDETLYGS